MSTMNREKYKAIGSRIRLIRTASQHSLDEIGTVLGVSRQYVFQIESGERNPTADHLAQLAHFFRVKPVFFERPISNYLNSESINFRHRQTTPDYKKREVISKSMILGEMIDTLQKYIRFPKYDVPSFIANTQEEIERSAELTRSHFGIPAEAPIGNLTRVVERAGVVVCTFGHHDEKIDAFSAFVGRPMIVVLKRQLKSCFRQRFDIAHELGHLVLHTGIETGSVQTERAADSFASAFLMPRRAVLREFYDLRGKRMNWKKAYQLKARWGVSVSAIVRRCFDLDIIDEDQYRSAYIYLSKTGQRKIEKYDDMRDFESPEALNMALQTLLSNKTAFNAFLSEISIEPKLISRFFGVPLPKGLLSAPAND